jgi:hypothetical protein
MKAMVVEISSRLTQPNGDTLHSCRILYMDIEINLGSKG